MATVKVLITLKPGVLDAPGQAIRQGLRALGYEVEEVRVGKYLEIVVPERAAGEAVANAASAEADEMCARYQCTPKTLANMERDGRIPFRAAGKWRRNELIQWESK